MRIYRSAAAEIAIPDVTITDFVFAGLAGREDAPALIDGPTGRVMTGAEFRDRVERMAGGLAARGIGPGHVVAIHAPNQPDWCVVFHAVAWAGGTATTLNPSSTAAEVGHQLRDAAAELLVTVPALLAGGAGGGGRHGRPPDRGDRGGGGGVAARGDARGSGCRGRCRSIRGGAWW